VFLTHAILPYYFSHDMTILFTIVTSLLRSKAKKKNDAHCVACELLTHVHWKINIPYHLHVYDIKNQYTWHALFGCFPFATSIVIQIFCPQTKGKEQIGMFRAMLILIASMTFHWHALVYSLDRYCACG
jgi:hypothetical protein